MKKILISFFLLSGLLTLTAETGKNNAIDYLGVAAVLIRGGNYFRAAETLAEVDTEEEDLDISRYYTLLGLVQLRSGEYRASLESFQRVIEEENSDPVIYAYIAQGHFALEEYAPCIEALEKLPRLSAFPDLYGLKSQALWYMDRKQESFDVLQEGIGLFPDKLSFRHQEILYFLELDLIQTAMERGQTFLLMGEQDPEIYLSLAEAFRREGEAEKGSLLMERALLLYPENRKIRLMAAQCYAQSDRPLSAAKLVEQLSLEDPRFTKDAADLYLEAGQTERAAYLNTLLDDPGDKALLRFQILLVEQDYEAALALIPRLERLGLLEEESTLYAAAYVQFQVQRYEECIETLNRIQDSRYFRQATALRQALEMIRQETIRYF